ncbi:hypothetical protein [Amycolatopsis thermoflava]|uniref:hypothetical protein n=1 Tax=Amycolatopsis thermoflava TaxID=84480 RepID=UPI003664F127
MGLATERTFGAAREALARRPPVGLIVCAVTSPASALITPLVLKQGARVVVETAPARTVWLQGTLQNIAQHGA